MNIKVPKRPTATAILQWKPRVPNRGEPLKFSHYGIYVANKQARIRLYFEDKHKTVHMLSNDMFTQRVSRKIRQWILNNRQHFDP